ncbi:MAG: potassium/proton antiporter [Bacteroidales bacterium]|nr:potassium/proton antiporter [Bacteroidales bacterium]MDD2426008.1 potassium/proton antiporter [Bacteroidales bacterium]MDD3990183.1 potassium/proton antiporter [Bacteroidales bacterium]MDD4639444.1 potassium/proton antiporter [Bacteroidales bacterium]
MNLQIELVLLVLSLLFFLSILAGKASSKFGIPALLLFLAVGMFFGSDGIGIEFENIKVAQAIGTVALCIILFSGGMDTKFIEIKPVVNQGIILATAGVFLTALTTGLLIWWIFGMTYESAGIGILSSLLLASTMASTDSASVFSILRSKGLNLKNNLRPMLELESGSNDPVAYVLVITLIGFIKTDVIPSYINIILSIVLQLVIGAVIGFAIGKLTVFIINRIHIGNDSLYPILVFTSCIFIFSLSYFLKGNGYLAVYIGGLIIGNSKFVHKRSSLNFFDGLAWMSQLLMFLTLGLLVNPRELLPFIVPGLLISFVMIFISRPLTVFLSLLPFRRMGVRDKVFVSWVGLRGAVPIIFAIIILAEDVPHADLIFNIVFICTLVSLLVQGTSIPMVAKWLSLAEKRMRERKHRDFDIEFADDIKSITDQIEIKESMLQKGNQLMDLPLPEKTLVIMIKREDIYMVPKGNTVLQPRDKLLVITDNQLTLQETYDNLKVPTDN